MNTQLSRTIVAAALALAATTTFARGPGGANPLQGTADSMENFTYGVCRGTDPACYHNWGVVHNNTVLIYSRTAAARNGALGDPLPTGNNPAMNATNIAQAGLKRILAAAGITVNVREDGPSNVTGLGSSTAAVIFLDNSGDFLWDHGRSVNPTLAVSGSTSAFIDAGRVNLRQYLRSGGGFVAIHNAVGAEPNWFWYQGLLGNAGVYDSGGPAQTSTVQIEAADSATSAIGPPGTTFTMTDSFYTLVPFPTEVKFLATVNTASLVKNVHPGHGPFHPVAWCQYYDGGRAFVTTLGQDPRLWADLSLPENQPNGANYFPGAAEFQKLIVNGVKSAMGQVPFCT